MYLIKNKVIYSTSIKEYFQYDWANKNTDQISVELFCKYLFGRHNYKLQSLLGYSNSIKKEKNYSSFHQNFDLFIYDKEGNLILRKKNFFEGFTPYEIQVNEKRKEVWVATGSGQIVYCKKIDSEKITFQLGIPYENKSVLSFPEGISMYENDLYIVEMGNKKISKLNMANKRLSDYFKFDEPVWNFQKNEFAEIVLLDSGIYELKDGKIERIDKQLLNQRNKKFNSWQTKII